MIGEIQRVSLIILLFTFSSSASNCGENVCKASEYCSEDSYCSSCEDVCMTTSQNYDKTTCQGKCSDYNMDNMFVKRSDFDAAVKEVYIYVIVSLVISLAVLLLVLVAIVTVWLKYQRMKAFNNNNEKIYKKKMDTIKAICVNEVDSPKKLKLEMPVPIPDKDTPPSALTTMTPLSRRHPSEDATLEYAYDNPTLTHSPIFGKNEPANTPDTTPKNSRTETSF